MNKIAFEVPQDYTLTRDRDSLKLIWHIECDTDQTLQSVRSLDGVPSIGTCSPLAANLFASKIRFEMRSSRYFRATVEYTSVTANTTSESAENLADRPPSIRYFDECEMVPLEYCYSGDETTPATPVLNSAGDRFPEVPMIPRLRMRIEISWYTDRNMDGKLQKYFNTLNQHTLRLDGNIYAPQTLWCVRLQSAVRYNSRGREFTCMELTLRHDPANWNCKIMQTGYNAISSSGLKYPIRLADGEYTLDQESGILISEPALLDNNGHLLSAGNDAVYEEFRYLPTADWSELHIPSVKAIHNSFGGLA